MNYSIAILAAGKSSRFDGEKVLAKINNQTLISKIIFECLNTNCSNIYVITKPNKLIIDEIKNHKKVKILINENNTGIASSIKLAMKKIPEEFILFVNADQYFINSNHLTKLTNFSLENNKTCFTKVNNQLTSPTVIYKKQLKNLNYFTADNSFKMFIEREKIDYVFFETTEKDIIMDIDTKLDLENVKRILKEKNN